MSRSTTRKNRYAPTASGLAAFGLLFLACVMPARAQGPGGEIIEKPAANPPVHRVSPSRGRRRSRTPAANQLIEQAIDLANKARDAGHHDESAAAYGRVLLLKPGESRAYYGLGNVFQDQDRTAEAIDAYQEAVRLKSDYAEARLALGLMYSQARRYDEALEQYQTAVRLRPNWTNAHAVLGYFYFLDLQRYDDAIKEYKVAIRLAPNIQEWHYDLGRVYRQAHRDTEAIEELKTAIHLSPRWVEAHYELGLTYVYAYVQTSDASYLRAAEDEARALDQLDSSFKAQKLRDEINQRPRP